MVRLGAIDYLNTQPFYAGLRRRMEGRVAWVRGVPTALNRALARGEVDLAPVSAVAAARMADRVYVFPYGIASLGAVKTVLLFSRRPDPRELDGRTIALTDQSATSVALLKLLAREHYRIAPRWVTLPQDLTAMLAAADAALLIGDGALVEASRPLPPGVYTFDLGDEWLKWTEGLPFVFALWAVRREAWPRVRALGFPEVLEEALREGLARIPQLAAAYAPRLGLPPGVCAKYLRDLRYRVGPEERAGLDRFLAAVLPEGSNLIWVEEAPEGVGVPEA